MSGRERTPGWPHFNQVLWMALSPIEDLMSHEADMSLEDLKALQLALERLHSRITDAVCDLESEDDPAPDKPDDGASE